jgi:hypothetical protein
MAIVAKPGTPMDELRQWVKDEVAKVAPPIAQFPANHLGIPDLAVFFLDYNGELVKVDIWTMSSDGLARLSSALVVHDPGGFIAAARAALPTSPASSPSPDYSDLHHKFCGWMWFTHSKIARSNLFEAIESLDFFMRGYALLPFLHLLASTPSHGYRHLEQQLPEPMLTALRATYPRSHDKEEVTRAFWALIDLFTSIQPEVEARLGTSLRKADLARMTELIRLSEQSAASQSTARQ